MRYLLDLVRYLFQYGRGRPVALVILLWTTSISVFSELSLEEDAAELTSNVTAAFSKARQFLFDGYQRYHPRTPQSQPVTIVAIDEKSLAELGQWPWPRSQLAALLDAIAAYQPAAVGLDMYMPEADQTSPASIADRLPAGTPEAVRSSLRAMPGNDAILARSLHNMPSVLGAAGFDHASYTTSAGMRSHPLLVSGGAALPHVRQFPAVLASLPELQAAAWGQAVLSVDLDFGVVRRVPLVSAIGDTVVSGLAMEMLRIASGDRAVRVQVGDHGIESVGIADLNVPTQPGGEIWLHFASIDDTRHRYVSASAVLDGSVDPDMLGSKLVLLGLTGSGLHDMRTTALGELVPGIEIQAQVLETLFDGHFILRPWWMKWLETSIIFSLGLLLIWYLPRQDSALSDFIRAVPRASAWLTLAINLLLLALGYLLFRTQGLLFDASSLVLALSAVIASLIASTVIQLNRLDKLELETEQRQRERAQWLAGRLSLSLGPAEQQSHGDDAPVGRLTRRLASRAIQEPALAVPGDIDIDKLARAAQYRDIGLAQVDPAILNSPQPLGPEDRNKVNEHAGLGARAAALLRVDLETGDPGGSDFLCLLEEVAHYHHERWDGDGYPTGIGGSEIPFSARVVAIIDTWNSITRDRPWRPAMAREAALELIRSGAGQQFDPQLAELFVKMMEEDSPRDD